MITQEKLKQLLYYHPESGDFVWEVRAAHKLQVGDQAGKVHSTGCLAIGIQNKQYRAHRLAWLYMTGSWPEDEIDHKNRNKLDNSWGNLRSASRSDNGCNKPVRAESRSGLKGVQWHPKAKKYQARIYKEGKKYYLGLFLTSEAAYAAYREAAARLHGEFAHG